MRLAADEAVVDDFAHDYLVILARAAAAVTDAGLLTAFCDGALWCRRPAGPRSIKPEKLRRILDQVGDRLLGLRARRGAMKGATAIAYGDASEATAATAATRATTPPRRDTAGSAAAGGPGQKADKADRAEPDKAERVETAGEAARERPAVTAQKVEKA